MGLHGDTCSITLVIQHVSPCLPIRNNLHDTFLLTKHFRYKLVAYHTCHVTSVAAKTHLKQNLLSKQWLYETCLTHVTTTFISGSRQEEMTGIIYG